MTTPLNSGQELSDKIHVTVNTQYMADHPASEADKFAFAYEINIANHSAESVQLINRYWLIIDGNGKQTEVEGAGVVGEQPHIASGNHFQYTSGAVLDTPVGSMQGYYEMQDKDGAMFRVPIDIFSLAVPHLIN
ncbi:MAG: Co2+/Mg2+ efflux protein ApaG [Paraglaciecola polaris]|uniref:Co2+/Mg2+ efflux protein ApaG n=1 Tax=Paraglaciecola polaris TaxID=222814 RepID=UPI003001FA65|tara:strand:- start:3937 stop:4338 length:402 start_codon:yes stop_codon:yes gene_type:complete